MRTSQKIALGFVGVIFLIVVVDYISTYQNKKVLQRVISRHAVERARDVISEIDRDIYRRLEQVQAYTKDLKDEDVLEKSNLDFDRLNNVQEVIKQRDEEWQTTSQESLTPLMQEMINNELSGKIREEFELKEFYVGKYGYPVFAEVFVTNKYGANAAQSQRTTDYYQADEKWWQEAKKNGFYVSDIVYDESARVYSIDICARVDDASGDFLGALKVVFNTAEIVHILEESKKVSAHVSTQFNLLNSEGQIIYSTEDYSFMKDLFDKTPPFRREQVHNYFISKGDKTGGTEKLFAYAHSQGHKEFKGLGWTLVVENKTKDIFAPTTVLKRRLLFSSLAILLLAISAVLLFSKKISEPLKKIDESQATGEE